MRTPLVSILIPVYNVEEYLERCLDSLIKQSLTQIEIICVDDGSTDGSLKILQKYKKKDRRITIIHKENGGLPSARNAGLDVAKGKYVGFVDSDDYVEEDMFLKLYETAEKENSEVVICGAKIFPEVPRATQWLYDCLSPRYKHYEEFEADILFKEVSTTPFLWRTLIKRSLIETYSLRLDEKILLGEDKAFQAKVYPKAKGITVIPDKLYNYCWYREGSMMQQDVYKISDKKILGHCKLVEHIAKEINNETATEELKLQFLKWSIPLIYGDFISLPLATKLTLAPTLIDVWTKCGYYNLKWRIESWIIEQFQYVYEILKEKETEVAVSVVVPVSDRTEYTENALKSILSQSLKNIECIIVNNAGSNATYSILHKYLFKDKRVRLYNMDKSSYAKALNNGIQLATGQYVTICETSGWYVDESALENWYNKAIEEEVDICAALPCIKENNAFNKKHTFVMTELKMSNYDYMENDFHNVLYKTEFVKEKEIVFEDNSIITGVPFLLQCCAESSKKNFVCDEMYVNRRMHRLDWISTEKCQKVLKALYDLMKYSVENKNADIQARVISMINGDYLKRIILNNTKAYCMPPWERPNGENSQIEIVEYLYGIFGMVDAELLEKSGYNIEGSYLDILHEFIEKRQEYLSDLSDRYHRY